MDLIDRQKAIDALTKHLRTTDVPASYPGIITALTEWLDELPSAQPDVPDINVGDMISRQAAIEIANDIRSCISVDGYWAWIERLQRLPSAQPEPIWGLPVSADRPLADVEIVSRLRDIQKQIPGGSYAIDRAIEIIEAVAERRTDEPEK